MEEEEIWVHPTEEPNMIPSLLPWWLLGQKKKEEENEDLRSKLKVKEAVR